MEKIRFETKTIKEIIENQKIYNMDLPYQRNGDAWTKKNKESLIDSIENYFLIPPIILNKRNDNNFDVLDGKQRLTTIFESSDKFKRSGLNYELAMMILQDESEEKIKESFIRINKNSIKLNKNEFLLADANFDNRKFFLELAQDQNYKELIKNNKKSKRFSHEEIIIWIFSIINMQNKTSNSSIRNECKKIVKKKFEVSHLNNESKKFKKTFELLNNILNKNILEPKNFKTFFSAIFVAFYLNINESTYLMSQKESINNSLKNINEEIKKDQMGGGTKFDGLMNTKERIHKIESILINLIKEKDKKRQFSQEEKNKKLIEQNYKCARCGTLIENATSHADHIIPFSKGGLTNLDNLQILCKYCNLTKSNK